MRRRRKFCGRKGVPLCIGDDLQERRQIVPRTLPARRVLAERLAQQFAHRAILTLREPLSLFRHGGRKRYGNVLRRAHGV